MSICSLVGGIIVGLCYSWKLALVGTACVPLTLSAGIVRLRVVNLKDEKTRKAHGNSAQVACEAVSSVFQCSNSL
jgi:ATP-binding cassette subfamily B (MDR/TAP) protein 1